MGRIDSILQKNLSIKGFELWSKLKERIPDIWSRPSSSTMKYHKKDDGRVPSISEHTLEMINAADKIISMFQNMNMNLDVIFLGLVLHDSFKYGLTGNNPHTDNTHDKIIGDTVRDNQKLFMKLLSESDTILLESIVRFHSGKWSTDAKKTNFEFKNYPHEVLFIHMLDMLSTKDVLKLKEE